MVDPKIVFRCYSIYRALFGATMAITGITYIITSYEYGRYLVAAGIVELSLCLLYSCSERHIFKYVEDNFDDNKIRLCHLIVSMVFCISPECIYIYNVPLTCLILLRFILTLFYLVIIVWLYIAFLFCSVIWIVSGYLYFGVILALIFVIQLSIEFTNGAVAELYIIKCSLSNRPIKLCCNSDISV